jgi:hypothetical protein
MHKMVCPLQAGLINPFAISYLGSGKLTNTSKKIFITTFIQTETFISPFSSGVQVEYSMAHTFVHRNKQESKIRFNIAQRYIHFYISGAFCQ